MSRFDWEERSESTPFILHAAAGSCAGWTEHSVTYPLDTLKTRIQATRRLTRVPRTSLFRGLPAVLAASVPAHASLFSVYELARPNGRSRLERLLGSDMAAGVAGGLSITAHDLIMTPADVVKQRLQLGGYKGVIDCVTQVVTTEGLRALYRSLPVTLFMNVPNTGLMLMIHERIKSTFQSSSPYDSRTFPPFSIIASHFGSAGIAGAIAAAATTPLDVIKTRMQTQRIRLFSKHYTKPGGGSWLTQPAFYSKSTTPKYATAWSTFKILIREEGFPVLFKGALPRALVAAPGTALCWGGYELSKNTLTFLFPFLST